MDEMAKSADRLGVASEKFIGLKHAADIAGGSIEDIQMVMERLAVRGTVKPLYEAFLDLADGVRNTADEAEKLRLVKDVLGVKNISSIAPIVNLLNEGREGISNLVKDAEDLGYAIDRKLLGAVERMNDSWVRTRHTLDAIFQQVAIAISPVMEVLAKRLAAALNLKSPTFMFTVREVFKNIIVGLARVVDFFQYDIPAAIYRATAAGEHFAQTLFKLQGNLGLDVSGELEASRRGEAESRAQAYRLTGDPSQRKRVIELMGLDHANMMIMQLGGQVKRRTDEWRKWLEAAELDVTAEAPGGAIKTRAGLLEMLGIEDKDEKGGNIGFRRPEELGLGLNGIIQNIPKKQLSVLESIDRRLQRMESLDTGLAN